MMKRLGVARTTYLAYVLLLLTFVLLGLFVAALAYGSGLAIAAGVGLLVVFGASVMGFRAGGAQIARASDAAGHKLSVWVDPLQESQISQYRMTYRGEHDGSEIEGWTPTVKAGGDRAPSAASHVRTPKQRIPALAGRRLSA
jgi:hypothetical protein